MKVRAQIREAMKILAPVDAVHRTHMRRDIVEALKTMDIDTVVEEHQTSLTSKQARTAFRNYKQALTRAQRAWGRLPETERLFGFKRKSDAKGALDFAHHIATCDYYLALRAPKPQPPAHRQKSAARHAHWLLNKWGRPAPRTPYGPWDRLSAILFGEPGRSLTRHFPAKERAGAKARPTAKKRSGAKKVPPRD